MKKLLILIGIIFFSLVILRSANFQLLLKPVSAQDDGGSGGDSGGGDSGGSDSGSGDSGVSDGGSDQSGDQSAGTDTSGDNTQGGTDGSTSPGTPGAPDGEGGDPTSQGGSWSPDGLGGQEISAPGQDGVVGSTAEGVTYSTGGYAMDQAVDVDMSQVPSGVPEGAAFWSGDGWSVGVPSGAETSASAETGSVVGTDPVGGNNEGNTQGGGDTPTNTGPPPCTTNCSSTPPAAFYQNLPVAYSCGATSGNPTIRTSWSSSGNFSDYYIYYLDSAEGILRGGWSTGGREYYDFISSSNLVSGHQYGFTVMAVNNAGYQTISDGGLWSHQKFGVFTTFPDCTPATVTLSQISNVCTAGGSSLAELGFSSSSPGVEAFHLDKNGVYYSSAFPANPSIQVSLAPGESADFTARIQVGGVIYGGLNTVTLKSADCIPSVAPVITLTLTTPNGTFPTGGLPITIRQNETATINWQIELADSAQASSNPNKAEWGGSKNKVSGSQVITTTSAGSYVLTLKAANVVGESVVSIQLNVLQYPAPYIQTTGGDVHSNETIYMTPP